MDLSTALNISAQGMDVQGTRLRVIAENLANQQTTGSTPGAAPYRRKTISFASAMDNQTGGDAVRVRQVGVDNSAFPQKYDPSSPAADPQGYVKMPNVNSFVEVMDMRDAQQTYNANVQVMTTTRGMLTRTIQMLK